MKVCKIKPTTNDCCCCREDQLKKYIVDQECKECLSKRPDCEILQIVTTIFGKVFALVLVDGKIEKLPIERLYDVREVYMVKEGNYGY